MLKMRNTLCNSNEVYLTSKHIETKKLRSYMQWSKGGKVESLFPKSFTKMYHRALSDSHIRKCGIEDVIRMQQELFTLYQVAGLSTDTIVSLAEQEITKRIITMHAATGITKQVRLSHGKTLNFNSEYVEIWHTKLDTISYKTVDYFT